MKKLVILALIIALTGAFASVGTLAASAEELPIVEAAPYGFLVSFNNYYYKYGEVEQFFLVKLGDFSNLSDTNKQQLLEQCADSLAASGFETTIEDYVLRASMLYGSLTDIYIERGATGYDEPVSDSVVKRISPFYMQDISTDVTVFDIWYETVISDLVFNAFKYPSIKDIEFEYNFATSYPFTRLDTNADTRFHDVENGLYIHTFTNLYNDPRRQVVMTQTYPDITSWYLLSIGIGVAVLAVGVVIIVLGAKKHN